jgi:acetyl esterase/lipase
MADDLIRPSKLSKSFVFTGLALLLGVAGLSAQPKSPDPKVLRLWPEGAPGAVGDLPEDRPALSFYLPEGSPTGAGIVICPGGGYGHLAMDHEGVQVARWLNSIGVAAFVLQYRLGPRYRHPAPLQDAWRALRHVRQHAAEYSVRPTRIGIWGFSAGGHLAATAATHFDRGRAEAADPVDRVSSRPDFLILGYPVISFTSEHTHRGSLRNLLGEDPEPGLVESLSNEKRVTADTPPTFLFHTNADTGVPAENSVLFYLALRQAGVQAELHIYERGRHGVGLAPTDRILSSWTDRLADWLYIRGVLTP